MAANDVAPGDEVFGHLAYSRETKLGAFAEYTLAPAGSLALKPEAISHETAAASATAIASSSSAEFVRSLGADEVIERDRTDPFAGSDRYDVVFDTPAVHSYGRWVHRLKPGGSYVTTLPSLSFVTGKLRSWLSGKGCHLVIVKSRRADLELLGRWIVDGLRVPIGETYPLERVGEALKRLQHGGMRGRLAISF